MNAVQTSSVDTLRDVIVKGIGMEQLLDMRCARGGNPNEYVEETRKPPVVLKGSFDRIEANRGYLRIQAPGEWRGKEVKFTLERGNSLSKNQLTHKLETFAGFSYEGFRAMDQYVRDISADEDPPQLRERKSSEKENSPIRQKDSKTGKEHRTQISKAYAKNQIYTFIPSRCDSTITQGKRGCCSGWINGKIEGIPAGISIENDISRFDTDSIERWGGLEEVVKQLARKESLPCVILKKYGENRYAVSLFQTDKTLNELLKEAPIASREAEDSVGQNKVVLKEKAKVSNGEKVFAQIDRIDIKLRAIFGSFEHEGESYCIKVPLKTKKAVDATQKAYKQRKPITVLITGCANGLYAGKKL